MENTAFEIIKNKGIAPGMIAVSTKGHDKQRIYLVLACREKMAVISDGNKRNMANPKRKRVTHIKGVAMISDPDDFLGELERTCNSREKDTKISKIICETLEKLGKK